MSRRPASFAVSLLNATLGWLASLWPTVIRTASEETDKGFTIDPNG